MEKIGWTKPGIYYIRASYFNTDINEHEVVLRQEICGTNETYLRILKETRLQYKAMKDLKVTGRFYSDYNPWPICYVSF